ncbi:unnamed protein product [Lupinus luteus]|uniref:Uncharacterized protein n=1 Tax=Lupinus luteus TaxID=3873 RepID=A0AAV1WCC2_LUPLU
MLAATYKYTCNTCVLDNKSSSWSSHKERGSHEEWLYKDVPYKTFDKIEDITSCWRARVVAILMFSSKSILPLIERWEDVMSTLATARVNVIRFSVGNHIYDLLKNGKT